MAITQIAKARKCGQVRFHALFDYCSYHLNTILEMCGLKPEADKLLEVSREDAVRVLVCWLHRDAAYKTELMSENLARELSEKFVAEFSDETSRYFTNGQWHDAQRPQTSLPLTEATFDGGIIIESRKGNDSLHACIWFEDED